MSQEGCKFIVKNEDGTQVEYKDKADFIKNYFLKKGEGDNNVQELLKPTQDAISQQEAVGSVLRNEGVRSQGELQGVGEQNELPEPALKEEAKAPKKKIGRYDVELKPDGSLDIRDSKGKEPSETTKRNVKKKWADNFDYSEGDNADLSKMPDGISTEAEAESWVVENSSNPKEIAEVYMRQPGEMTHEGMADHLIHLAGGVGKTTRQSFTDAMDENLITNGVARKYFRSRSEGGVPLDVQARELSDQIGVEITPYDLARHMLDDIEGKRPGQEQLSGVQKEAIDKFHKLTGLDLENPDIALKAVQYEDHRSDIAAGKQREEATAQRESYNEANQPEEPPEGLFIDEGTPASKRGVEPTEAGRIVGELSPYEQERVTDQMNDAVNQDWNTFKHNNEGISRETYLRLRQAAGRKGPLSVRLSNMRIDTEGKLYDASLGLPIKIYNEVVKELSTSVRDVEKFVDALKSVVNRLNSDPSLKAWSKGGLLEMAKVLNEKYRMGLDEDNLRNIIMGTGKKGPLSLSTANSTPEKLREAPRGLIPIGQTVNLTADGDATAALRAMFSRGQERIYSQAKKAGDTKQRVYEATIKSATYKGKSQALFSQAINNILNRFGKKRGKYVVNTLTKVLVQSRLNGLKDRYNFMAQHLMEIDNESIDSWYYNLNNFAHENDLPVLKDVVESLSHHPQFIGSDRQVEGMMSQDNHDGAKQYIANMFNEARKAIHDVDFSDIDMSYDEARSRPDVQEAKAMFKANIEPELKKLHQESGGSLMTYLGEEDTYFPLELYTPDGETKKWFNVSKTTPLKPLKVTNNQFATGLAQRYSTEISIMNKRLENAAKVHSKNMLLEELEKAGMMTRWVGPEFREDAMNINGVDREAVKVNLADEGKTPDYRLIPKEIEGDLNRVFEFIKKGDDKTLVKTIKKMTGIINAIFLSTPLEALYHGANLTMRLANNTPFAFVAKNEATNFLGKTLGSVPIFKQIMQAPALYMMHTQSPYWQKIFLEMADAGAVPEKFGSHTFSSIRAELTGAKVDHPYPTITKGEAPTKFMGRYITLPSFNLPHFGTLLYGYKGLDIRARMMLWAITKEYNPNATPHEMQRIMTTLGEYNPKLQSDLVRGLKSMGDIATFAVSGHARIYNMFKSIVGGNLATESLGNAKAARIRAMTLANSSLFSLLAVWVGGYMAQTGKNPLTTPGSMLGRIPLTDDNKKWLMEHPNTLLYKLLVNKNGGFNDINVGAFYGAASGATRLLGVDKAYEYKHLAPYTSRANATDREAAEYGILQGMQTLMSPVTSSPTIQTVSHLFGVAPYIVSLQTREGQPGPQFLPMSEPDMPGYQLQNNLLATALSLNPLGTYIGHETGLIQQPKSQETDWERGMYQTFLQSMFPRLFVGSPNYKMKDYFLNKQREASRRTSSRYKALQKMKGKREPVEENDNTKDTDTE